MKATLRILPLMLGVLLFFTQCEKEAIDLGSTLNEDVITLKNGPINGIVMQTLWAGAGQNDTTKGTNVGKVTAVVEGNFLKVKYTVNAPYYLTEGHLWVGKNKLAIPRQAAPGRFPFKAKLNYESEWSVNVNLTLLGINPNTDVIYVSAHGVVVDGFNGLAGLNKFLPVNLSYSVVWQNSSTLSYFKTTVNHGGILGGVFDGWCIDTKNQITPGTVYDAIAYSSYGNYPANLFEKPESLELVNWIINQNLIGAPSTTVPGTTFTRGDVQKAMWQLLEHVPQNIGGEGPFNQTRVNEIKAMAIQYGVGFVPGCGEKVAIILYIPNAVPPVQITIIEYPIPCGGSDTVWAYGQYTFEQLGIAKKWGWIFEILP